MAQANTSTSNGSASVANRPRSIAKIFEAEQFREGGGFRVARPIGGSKADVLDPILLVDHLLPTRYGPHEFPGAPWHPHRGFMTVTYLLQGEMQHRDSMGNSGILRAGDCQFMSAGSGVLHDETGSPAFNERGGTVEGFQIWINLAAKDKFSPPTYTDVQANAIPTVQRDNFLCKVIAGRAFDVEGPVHPLTPVQYLDFHLSPGASFVHRIPAEYNAVLYVYRGELLVGEGGGQRAGNQHAVLLQNDGEELRVRATGEAKFLLLAGAPLREPVVRRGPFVLNTAAQLRQAFEDYASGQLATVPPTFVSRTKHDSDYNPDTAKIV